MNRTIKLGLLIGIINLAVGMVFNFGFQALVPEISKEYQSGLFRPWTDPLMTAFFLYPFIAGLALAYLWSLLKSVEGKSVSEKALNFAIIYFLVATVPGMFITYTSFQISALMVGLWTLSGLIQAYIAGFILAKSK